MRSGIL